MVSLVAAITLALSVGHSLGFNITILHTNDVHSHFDEYNPFGGQCTPIWQTRKKCFGGFSRLVWKVRNVRENEPNVIVLDAGDQFQGTVWYSVFGYKIVAHFMNRVGYDVMALGNHEFDDGVEGLLPFVKNVSFPVISSNLDISQEPRLHGLVKDTHVSVVDGEKIGIVGFITDATTSISQPGPTLSFGDELKAIQEEVDALLSQDINKIIALGHSGYHKDLEIARLVRGVDIVIGGHTNTFLYTGTPPSGQHVDGPYPTVVTSSVEPGRKILVVQDSQFAAYLGYLKVSFDDSGEIINWSGNPLFLDSSVPKDVKTEGDLQEYKAVLLNRTSHVVGKTRVLLSLDNCKTQECNVGNMVCDAFVFSNLKRSNLSNGWNDVSISVMNAGGMRNHIEENSKNGNITLSDVINCLPFGDTLHVVEIHGGAILKMLEHSISQPGHPRFLQMSGIKVKYNVNKPVGSRVKEVQVLCSKCRVPKFEKLNPSLGYRIILPSFLFDGGDGYEMFRSDRISYQTIGELDIDAVTEFMKQQSPLTTKLESRITFVEEPAPCKKVRNPFWRNRPGARYLCRRCLRKYAKKVCPK